ncbi:MAG: hypothetical protein MZV70_68795 [Desulfobacterales bacterium]|nr:hypothetical protein [Desulfobacterales bacterium]
MPLIDGNRIIARSGLMALQRNPLPLPCAKSPNTRGSRPKSSMQATWASSWRRGSTPPDAWQALGSPTSSWWAKIPPN